MAASRKRKRNTVKKTLKYEVYGILFLIFSVITLASTGADSGVGSVGRSLGSICYFLAGKLPFVIPLVFIYIGLYVMIYRKWPKRWTARRSGVLLAVIAVLITYQMNEFHAQGFPYTVGDIIKHPFDNLTRVLSAGMDQAEFRTHAGGGLIGALSYGLLYFLFADIGAILMVIALLAISFVYITGLTYTDMFRSLRRRLAHLRKVLKARFRDMFKKRRKNKMERITPDLDDDDTDDNQLPPILIDEETYNPHRRAKKKPVFMNLFFSDKDKKDERDDDDREEEEFEDDDWQEDSEHSEYQDDIRRHEDGRPYEEDEPLEGVSGVYASHDAQQEPVFRDFLERVEQQVADLESEEDHSPVVNVQEDAAIVSEDESDEHADPVLQAEAQPTEPSKLSGKEPDIRIQLTPVPVKEQRPYQLPPFSLLNKPSGAAGKGGQTDYLSNARKLEATLESFGVRAKVLEVVRGPAVTRYEIQPDVGVKVSRIVNLTDDIALALAAKDIRMEAPIPGKSAIGIEIPNDEISVVTLREVMESPAFHESASRLSIALGRDISGQAIVANLAKMPHLLVAGATGSGKSVCINGIITSILYKAKPSEVKFLLIDPKMVELSVYNGIPHLLSPVVTDPRRASLALKKIVMEMEKRYELFSKSGIRNIEGYNSLIQEKIASGDHSQAPLPYIVVIVDELADLMMVAASDVEESITRIAQKARAAGIHLILATQRPSVDVITGVIKANIPSRIAFGVSSQVDSRTILDSAGAEKLLGRGDMLFMPVGAAKPIRIQGAFLSDQEVEAVCDFVRKQEEVNYRTDLVPEVEESQESADEYEDELYDQAVQIVIEAKQASVSLLQRRMRIGYTRAARLIDAMEAKGVVGPYEGSKPREVLMTMEQYQQRRSS